MENDFGEIEQKLYFKNTLISIRIARKVLVM